LKYVLIIVLILLVNECCKIYSFDYYFGTLFYLQYVFSLFHSVKGVLSIHVSSSFINLVTNLPYLWSFKVECYDHV